MVAEGFGAASSMRIEFVNHASILVEHNGVSVLCDPWLWGSAFMNGWDLLCASEFPPERFETIDYIWFSHEHPDHFSPRVLASIPESLRPGITILFQSTKDQRVLDFCKKQGFRTMELPDQVRVSLGGGLELQCGQVLFFDSWACFFADGKKVLNVNDCCVDGGVSAEEIKQHTGEVDVLLTQFSYAAWKGGPGDKAMREASAAQKLEVVAKQIEAFAPSYTIPFASYVYFSHEENRYLNDSVNRPGRVCEVVEGAGSIPVVMRPGQRWEIDAPWDNPSVLAYYEDIYDGIGQRAYHAAGPSVSLAELFGLCERYLARLAEFNDFRMIRTAKRLRFGGFFQPFVIELSDLAICVRFDVLSGLKVVSGVRPDVQMHSESLAFVFQHDFGFDTLSVNGRFQSSLAGFSKMAKNFAIGPLNSTGRYVDLRFFLDFKMIEKFVSSLRGFVTRMKAASAQQA